VDELHLVGRTLGNYQILEEIGRGGMAIVYRAYQPSLNRHVAIKVLPPHFTFDRQFVERFLREAQAAASLRHPNIVVVHDVAEQNGLYYIVMEYLQGQTLRQLIEREGPLSPARVARMVERIASALDYAHQRGFVHRDVKPGNIFVGPDDHPTLTDFGIAKAASGTQLTRSGMLIGTPEYMSPEQAQGENVDRSTDIYALGIVVYQMLSGQVPFGGTTPHAILYKQIHESPPPLRALQPGLPRALEDALARALAKDPRARYPNAEAFAKALADTVASLQPAPPATRPVWPWMVGGIVGIALILIISLAILSPKSPVDPEATARALARIWATQTAEAAPTPDQSQPAATLVPTDALPHSPDPATHTPTATGTTTTSTPPTSTPTPSQTHTPTPTSSRTATLTATPTRTSTPTTPPPPTGFFLDNFEGYGSDASLRSAYGINAAWGTNVGQLSLASPPNVCTGNRGAAFYYEIRNPAPDDYAGFERSFPAQNWQPFSVLHVWVKSDRSPRDLLVQFREVSGEVWRYRTNLSAFASRDLRLPLNESTFQHADWSPYQNGRMDLGAIEYYGFYVGNGGQGSGTVYIDDLSLE
jgi:serine/threonine protein kinase